MSYISIVLLLLLSAFFSASETALFSLNRIRLGKRAQDGDPRARAALALTERYGKTLNTILVGNNLVNIATSTIAALIFTSAFKTYGALISTAVTTLLVLTFGEILPKSYAAAHSDDVSLAVAKPLGWLAALLIPFTFLFGKLQDALGSASAPEEKPPSITEEELRYFIESIEEEGVLEEEESELVQSALEFDETSLREVITPRVSIQGLDADSSQAEIKQALMSARHSRMPIYEDSIDNIVGVIFVRDVLARLLSGQEVRLREICEEPYFVHKGMKLSSLMGAFRRVKARMAVVLDEYGGTLGIVTLVDLLEELVGDLYDEEEEEFLRPLEEGCFEVTGGYGLWDMLEELGMDEDGQDSDYSTVNGWAASFLGHIPQVGEGFSREGYRFTVRGMEGRRILRLEARREAADRKS